MYKPLNQQEWDRWNAFAGYSESEWLYSVQHGTEALERLVCRGANHLIPPLVAGEHTPWIEAPELVPVRIPVPPVVAVQEAAAEAELPPLPDSPVSDQDAGHAAAQAMSSLNLH